MARGAPALTASPRARGPRGRPEGVYCAGTAAGEPGGGRGAERGPAVEAGGGRGHARGAGRGGDGNMGRAGMTVECTRGRRTTVTANHGDVTLEGLDNAATVKADRGEV